jgi:hypothetical protein
MHPFTIDTDPGPPRFESTLVGWFGRHPHHNLRLPVDGAQE